MDGGNAVVERGVDPANIVITTICGGIVGYAWYRVMRWRAGRNIPSRRPPGRFSRLMASIMTNRWTDWTALMVLTGVVTAWLRGYADSVIPAGEWHGLLSGLFVIIVWPSLMWSLRILFRHYPMGVLSLLWPDGGPRSGRR